MQGNLAHVEGISLTGVRAELITSEALGRMPQLRILILDGVKTDSMLSGFHLPRLAMLSWRGAHGPSLPIGFEGIVSATILNVSRNDELERLPDLQACSLS